MTGPFSVTVAGPSSDGKSPRWAGSFPSHIHKRVTNSTTPRADEDDGARLSYSFEGETFVDTGCDVRLRFAKWKGARMAVYCFGPNGGWIDVDYLRFTHGSNTAYANISQP